MTSRPRAADGPAPVEALADWLEAIAAGDDAAFRALHVVAAPRLLRIARRIVGASGLADDVLQESFVRVWQNAGSYRRESSAPMTWLASIVRHRAIDALRSATRQAVPLDDLVDHVAAPGPGPDDLLSHKQIATCFARHLTSLQSPQRQALYLTYYQGLTQTEISAHMDIPLGTVKTWIRRGMTRWIESAPDARSASGRQAASRSSP